MGKCKKLQAHHLYLGAGGMLAVAALVVALTFGLSSAQDMGTCPAGTTGVPPNCIAETCPSGMTGVPPNCMAATCPSGMTGVPPNCIAETCPSGMTGVPPNCMAATCPSDMTGIPPNCTPIQGANTCPQSMPIKCADGRCALTQLECTGGQMPPPTGGTCTTAMPTTPCTNGAYMCENSAWVCRTSTTPPPMGGTCTTAMPTTPCTNGYYMCENSAWVCKTSTMPPPTGGRCPDGSLMPTTGMCPPTNMMPPQGQMQPGQCPQNMQKCPDTYNPLNTVCMPLKTYFDMKTGKNIPEGRAATCADFQAPQGSMNTQTQQPTDSRPQWMMGPIGQMGPQMGPQMGTMNQGKFNFGQDSGPDYCQTNFNDPICKGGFGDNLKEMGQQYKFDMNQFDTTQFQMPMRDMKMELRDIKQETQGWSNDAKQVRQQLKEISRGSGGIACPTAVEADALATELENAVANVKSVLASSSTEDIQKALAIRDHINGRFDKMNDQQVLGIRQQLFGGPPDEDGNPTQGKMQGLNVCREITGAVYGACETQKRLSEDYTYMKEDGAPDEVLKVFEGVIGELKDRCQNPFSVLSKEGISLEELSQPFYPPDSCQGYGMGKFAPPMDQGSMNFMPPPMEGFQDMPEDMQRMIKEKMNNYGDQGQNNFQGFNPFGTSVLTAQGQPMMGRPPMGMGPMQIPDECKPPVQRYLGIDSLMLKLEDSRIQAQQGMESANICDMFKQGKKMLEKGSRKGPPQEARDLIEEGLTACENDDFETLEGLKFIAMDYMKREQMGNLVDPSELLKSKFKERIGRMRKAGSEEGTKAGDKALTSQLVEAERRLTELTAKLDEAQKTILALNEKMSEMATKLASAIELNDQSSAAVGNIARISDEMVQQTVAGTISDLAD
ncbi:MAG: hypothetical protein AAB606_05470, partial [Patescibacteria group bacterium]